MRFLSKRTAAAAALPLIFGPVTAVEAYAEIYMTDQKAAETIFPGVVFKKGDIKLSSDDQSKMASASGEKVRADHVPVFRGPAGETVMIDQALGKHEFITYAVGVGKDGKVKGIEILEYRETYGGQVKEEPWRSQFVGKDKDSKLKLDSDIKNISGATLSSAHITNGVRRMLQTYEVIKDRT